MTEVLSSLPNFILSVSLFFFFFPCFLLLNSRLFQFQDSEDLSLLMFLAGEGAGAEKRTEVALRR